MTMVWVVAATVLVVLMLPYMSRAIQGPTVFDRLAGLNAMGTQVAVLLVLVGLLYEWVEMFVDIVLALFLLNFVATLMVARYVSERFGERA